MSMSTTSGKATVTVGVLWAAIATWFAVSVVGGITGVFDQPGKPPLLFGLILSVPVAGFVVAYASSRAVRRTLDKVPLAWITGAHIVRIVAGAVFVICVVNGTFPAQFGIPAGLGDIVSGAVAIPLTIALAGGSKSSTLRMRYLAWNVFGLTDLVSAILLGLLYSDSVVGVLRHNLSTAALADLPINLIPTFYVPMLALLHLLAFRRSAELAAPQG